MRKVSYSVPPREGHRGATAPERGGKREKDWPTFPVREKQLLIFIQGEKGRERRSKRGPPLTAWKKKKSERSLLLDFLHLWEKKKHSYFFLEGRRRG